MDTPINTYPDGVFLLTRMKPVHPPHFAVHGSVAQREPDRQDPGLYLAYVRENGRRYDLTVESEQVDAAEAQHASGQHDRVASRVRLRDHSVHTCGRCNSIRLRNVKKL